MPVVIDSDGLGGTKRKQKSFSFSKHMTTQPICVTYIRKTYFFFFFCSLIYPFFFVLDNSMEETHNMCWRGTAKGVDLNRNFPWGFGGKGV